MAVVAMVLWILISIITIVGFFRPQILRQEKRRHVLFIYIPISLVLMIVTGSFSPNNDIAAPVPQRIIEDSPSEIKSLIFDHIKHLEKNELSASVYMKRFITIDAGVGTEHNILDAYKHAEKTMQAYNHAFAELVGFRVKLPRTTAKGVSDKITNSADLLKSAYFHRASAMKSVMKFYNDRKPGDLHGYTEGIRESTKLIDEALSILSDLKNELGLVPVLTSTSETKVRFVMVNGSKNPWNPSEPLKPSIAYASTDSLEADNIVFKIPPRTKVRSIKKHTDKINNQSSSLYLVEYKNKTGWVRGSDLTELPE